MVACEAIASYWTGIPLSDSLSEYNFIVERLLFVCGISVDLLVVSSHRHFGVVKYQWLTKGKLHY